MSEKICFICNKTFGTYQGLGLHISKFHKISPKEYYDIFIKKDNEGKCKNEFCDNKCTFWKINSGYRSYCSVTCKNKSKLHRMISQKNSKRLWEDPSSSYNSKKRSKKLSVALKKKWNEENSVFRTNEYRNKKSKSIKKSHEDPNSGYNTEEYRKKRSVIMTQMGNDPFSCYNTLECRNKRSESVKQSYKNDKKLLESRRIHLSYNRYNRRDIGKISMKQMKLFKLCACVLPYPILEYPCNGKNIDIAIPKLSIAIEYDEPYWHQDKDSDEKRQKMLEKEGWIFIRYTTIPDIRKIMSDVNEVLKNV